MHELNLKKITLSTVREGQHCGVSLCGVDNPAKSDHARGTFCRIGHFLYGRVVVHCGKDKPAESETSEDSVCIPYYYKASQLFGKDSDVLSEFVL
jgi:hypothetical protein